MSLSVQLRRGKPGLLCFDINSRLEKQHAFQESTAHAQQVGAPRGASALICAARRVDHAVACLPRHKLTRAFYPPFFSLVLTLFRSYTP
jgi:hypothetical protein